MSRPSLRAALAAALLLTLPASTGCRAKKALDANLDGLIDAVEACDRPAFDKLVAKSLANELDDGKFEHMCAIFDELGPYQDRWNSGIHVTPNGKSGNYELTFENGEISLELHMNDAEITGFDIGGGDWAKAHDAVAAEMFEAFEVYEIAYLDADGEPNGRGNTYAPGELILRLVVGGIAKTDHHKYALEIDTVVTNARGDVVWKSDKPHRMKVEAKPSQTAGVLDVHLDLRLEQAGTYLVEWTIRDPTAGATTEYSTSVAVEV